MPWHHFETSAYWLTNKIEAFVFESIKTENSATKAIFRLQNDDPAWGRQHFEYLGICKKPPHMSRKAYAAGMYIRETKVPINQKPGVTADG